MANTFDLATKYLPMIDEIYKYNSLSSVLDMSPNNVQFNGGNSVKVFKTSMQGLGNYSRNDGFLGGDVTGTWETMTLAIDRGRSFSVDRMDNEETLDQAFGTLVNQFMRIHVTPEADAYRFAKYAASSGIKATPGTLADGAAVTAAIDAANATMEENEVPVEGKYIFITPTLYTAWKASVPNRFATMTDRIINRDFETFDGLRIIRVPQTRFYTAVTLNDGKTSGQEAGGFAKSTAGKAINFMIIHPTAIMQITKHALPRIFSPDVNQKADAWKFDYRIYHDAFTMENKTKGIYLHAQA